MKEIEELLRSAYLQVRTRESYERIEKRTYRKSMIQGYRAYYNFIRPHMALNGKTPAQQAGLKIKLEKNKWLSLIKRANTEQ